MTAPPRFSREEKGGGAPAGRRRHATACSGVWRCVCVRRRVAGEGGAGGPSASPTEVHVLPSPAVVGDSAVTRISFPSSLASSVLSTEWGTLALKRPGADRGVRMALPRQTDWRSWRPGEAAPRRSGDTNATLPSTISTLNNLHQQAPLSHTKLPLRRSARLLRHRSGNPSLLGTGRRAPGCPRPSPACPRPCQGSATWCWPAHNRAHGGAQARATVVRTHPPAGRSGALAEGRMWQGAIAVGGCSGGRVAQAFAMSSSVRPCGVQNARATVSRFFAVMTARKRVVAKERNMMRASGLDRSTTAALVRDG